MARPNHYPRALPFRPPGAVTAAPATVLAPARSAAVPPARRLPLLVVAFCALFLCAGVGIGMLFKGQAEPRAEAPPRNDPPKPEKKDPPRQEEKQPAASVTSRPAPPQPETKPAPVADKTPPEVADLPDEVVGALGGLTASHLYQSYLNIGLLADAVEGEVYKPDEAKKSLARVAAMMATIDRVLERLAGQPLSDEEKKVLTEARRLSGLLRTQARELQGYWDTGAKEHATRFHQAREQAWEGIRTLLKLKE